MEVVMKIITTVTCELWFEFWSILDLANCDKAKLEGLLENIKGLKEDFIKKFGILKCALKSDFFPSSVLGMEKTKEVVIKIPNISRNKGWGKRLKSVQEIVIEKSKKPNRLCSNCGVKDFHNARTWPLKKRATNLELASESVIENNNNYLNIYIGFPKCVFISMFEILWLDAYFVMHFCDAIPLYGNFK